ncbi:acetylglutamate kinase [Anaerosporobacter sp.]
MNSNHICYTQYQVELLNQLRLLWNQHVFWTRSFIISTAANLGDLDAVTKRLLQNPSDFGKVFQMFYDEQTVSTFVNLFTEHLQIAADLVNAAKNNDSNGVTEARNKWYQNADEIAAFFARINPYWSEQIWSDLLNDHLQMTEEEATLRLSGKYAEDVKLFDQIELEALKMADYMFYGLLNYFSFQ